MRRLQLIFKTCVLCALLLSSCDRDEHVVDPENRDWLRALIEEVESDSYFAGAILYRHEWKGQDYYHMAIPAASCVFCSVYDQEGHLIDWSVRDDFEEYVANRKNEVVIWDWRDPPVSA